MRRLVLSSIFVIGSLAAAAQFTVAPFGPDTFAVANRSRNLIELHDTAAWQRFGGKLAACAESDSAQVSIVHIGDSHLQADFFSGEMRRCLHKMTGRLQPSRGLIFPYAVAGTNNPTNYRVTWRGEWTCHKSTEKECGTLGLTGMSATVSSDTAYLIIKVEDSEFGIYGGTHLQMFAEMGATSLEPQILYPEGAEIESVNILSQSIVWNLHCHTDSVAIGFRQKNADQQSFTLYGLNLFDAEGVEYHAAGVNGARVSSYLKCERFAAQLTALHPDLVIVSLGTNDSYMPRFDSTAFAAQLEKLVAEIRVAQPDCAILLTTPGNNKLSGKPNQNAVICTETICREAKRLNFSVWNFNAVMGAPEKIGLWYDAGLITSDYVHLTRTGYKFQAHLLIDALLSGTFWPKDSLTDD